MWRKFVLNSLYFSGLQSALTPYTGGQGSILMLHHVQNVKKTDFSPNIHLSASPEFLDRMILRLKTEGYDFISMDEVADRLKNPTDGKSPLWWEDMEHIIGAQKRVIVDFPEERREYDTSTTAKKYAAYKLLVEHLLFDTDQDVQREIVAKLCKAYGFDCEGHVQESVMNWDEVISLSKDPLCSIGAHTVNHYALSNISLDDVRKEIEESRDVIKKKIGMNPNHLAYPYGPYDSATKSKFKWSPSVYEICEYAFVWHTHKI